MSNETEIKKLFLGGESVSEISKKLGISCPKIRAILMKECPNEYKNPPRKVILERFQKEKPQKEDFIIAVKLGKDFPSSAFWRCVSFSNFSFVSVKQLYTEKMQKWITEKWVNFSIKLPSDTKRIEFSDTILLDTTNYEYSKRKKTMRDLFNEST